MKKTLLFFILMTSLFALDNNRKGFVVGLGAGFASLDEDLNYHSSVKISNDKNFALTSKLIVGYGFSDRLILHYSRPVSWGQYDLEGREKYKANSLSSLGLSFYLKDTVPSPYIYGGIAYATYQLESWGSIYGSGYELGLGYEFIKHTSIELNYSYSKYEEELIDGSISSIGLSINYLFY